MSEPLINIITRVSRREGAPRAIESIKSQTYKNIHHIITYEMEEIKEYILPLVDLEKTTLVKVPKYRHIPELSFSYNHHNEYTKFLEPNWEFWDRKVHINGEGFDPDYKLDVEAPRYEKEGVGWNLGYDFTFRMQLGHFPYNQYLKIAERYLKEGWVVYLDDDDVFMSDTTLEEFVPYLIQGGEDTLVFNKVHINHKGGLTEIKPNGDNWFAMKVGSPPILGAIGGCNFIFHSKYADYTAWDEWRGADYRTAKCLEEIIPNKVFLDKILVNVGNVDLKNGA